MLNSFLAITYIETYFLFISAGSGILQWTDCSYGFSRSLEDQYQEGRRMNNHIQRRWDPWSKTYVEKKFTHDLGAMTQFNYQTKVQKPLRRCVLSDPVEEDEEQDRPLLSWNLRIPSTGTAEPASTGLVPSTPDREAAVILEILAPLASGTAGPAVAAADTAADAAQPALAAADAALPATRLGSVAPELEQLRTL